EPVLRRAGAVDYSSAPIARRVLAFMIDLVLVSLLTISSWYVVDWLLPNDLREKGFAVMLFGCFPIPFAYFAGFEHSSWKATPGKRLLQIEVIDRSGVALNWTQSTFRLMLVGLNVGLWPISLTLALAGRGALHDRIAQTSVVRRQARRQPSRTPNALASALR